MVNRLHQFSTQFNRCKINHPRYRIELETYLYCLTAVALSSIVMQNAPGDVCASSDPGFQRRLEGVLALYIFTQYEASFKQHNPSKSLLPVNIYLPQGDNFVEGRVNMYLCICLPLTAMWRNLDILHHS